MIIRYICAYFTFFVLITEQAYAGSMVVDTVSLVTLTGESGVMKLDWHDSIIQTSSACVILKDISAIHGDVIYGVAEDESCGGNFSFDYGSFLGSLSAGLIAVGIFWAEWRRKNKNRKAENRRMLICLNGFVSAVVIDLNTTLNNLKKYAVSIQDKTISAKSWDGIQLYFTAKIREIDIVTLSNTFLEFGIDSSVYVDYVKDIEYLHIANGELKEKYRKYNTDSAFDSKKYIDHLNRTVDNLWNLCKSPTIANYDALNNVKVWYNNNRTLPITIENIKQNFWKPLAHYLTHDDMKIIFDDVDCILHRIEHRNSVWHSEINHYYNELNSIHSKLIFVRESINDALSA